MEVILLQDIANLGFKNDIVTVKQGYGRNFLIPQRYAIIATESSKKVLAENLKQRAHKEEKVKNDAVELAASLEGVTLSVGAKASTTGKIFGSVNNIQIAEALKEKGFDIDRKKIIVKSDNIKEVGSYEAVIKLHKEVSATISFEIIAE